MGKRKLRFDARKNYERKKHQRQLCRSLEEPSLVVSLPLSAYTSFTVSDLPSLHRMLISYNKGPDGWSITTVQGESGVIGMTLSRNINTLSFIITINVDCFWTLSVGAETVSLQQCQFRIWNQKLLSIEQVLEVTSTLEKCVLCIGNPDEKFVPSMNAHKGIFKNKKGNTLAFYDKRALPCPTIRHIECQLLISITSEMRCCSCSAYRFTLHSLASKEKVRSQKEGQQKSIHCNIRYLSTPEKRDRITNLRHENIALKMKIARLQTKLSNSIEDQGIVLDEELSHDFYQVLSEGQPPEETESFVDIFKKQQMDVCTRTGNGSKGIRWHPLMIRWCIYLRHQSSKAYETLRNSGCVKLPSQRTLRDYSHSVKTEAGFSLAVDRQLYKAANFMSNPEWHKFVCLLLDEIHIKENLVFNKHTGKMVGFVDLGEVNNHLLQFERSIEKDTHTPTLANSMMVVMVRGIFSDIRFPYVQFPCSSITGEQLLQPFWETVSRLERMEFKVLAATFDGASVNRRLVAIHDTSQKLIYKVINIHAPERRYIYFVSDPPHLIKTTRNCWASSNRMLWKNGKYISWNHLSSLYERDKGKATGLAMVPKLKYEHIHLTSFSKMRVDLAAQVLSDSVGKALALTGGPEATETSEFALLFDKFFDALNVRNFTNGTRYRKPFLHPYRHQHDERLIWLEKTFLKYLDDWETDVQARPGFTDSAKKRMLLSAETLLGLRMTAMSFIELTKYLFTLPEVKDNKLSFLSNRLCQDPLENFFGCQRQCGGTNDNPTVKEYYDNTESLRVVNSFCRRPVRGNCRGGLESIPVSKDDCLPIDKRKSHRRSKTQ